MRRGMVLLLALLASAPAVGRDRADLGSYEGLEIIHVRYVADGEFDRALVHRTAALRAGTPLTADRLERSIQALELLDLYDQVEVDLRPMLHGLLVSFQLRRAWMVEEVELQRGHSPLTQTFRFFTALSRRQVLRAFRTRPGDRLDPTELEAGLRRVQEFYKRHGYFNCRVSLETRRHPEVRTARVVLVVDERSATLVGSIRFKGRTELRPHYLRRAMETRIGSRFDSGLLVEDRERLRSAFRRAGYLDLVVRRPEVEYDPEFNIVHISIELEVGPPVKVRLDYPLHLWNWDWLIYRLEATKLAEILDAAVEAPLTPEALENGRQQMEAEYRSHGYPQALVILDRQPASSLGEPDRVTLRVEQGPRVRVGSVAFPGCSLYDPELLQRQILNRSGARLNLEGLEEDRLALQTFLRNRGFRDAKVGQPSVEQDEGAGEARISFPIQAGRSFRVAGVTLPEDLPVPAEKIRSILEVKPDSPFSQELLEGDRRRTIRFLRRMGYPAPSVKAEWREEGGAIQVDLRIEPGQHFRFGRIIPRGKLRTRWPVLAREIPFRQGEEFSQQAVLEGQRRITRLGLFSDVRLAPVAWLETDGERTLLLSLREQPRLTVEFGPGYNTEEGFRGSLLAYNSNLGGYGRYLGVSALVNEVERKGSITFREPYLASWPIAMDFRLFLEEEERDGFWTSKRGSRVGWTRRFSPVWRAVLGYRLQSSSLFKVQEDADLTLEDRQEIRIAALGISLLYDTRTDPRDPRGGLLGSFTLERAHELLGSEALFWRSEGQLAAYRSLSRRNVLAASLRLGVASNRLPLSERFLLGGMKSIRGFDRDQVAGPVDLGGSYSAVVNLELRTDLIWGFGGVLFLDSGNVWESHIDVDLGYRKTSTGVGLRFMLPIGPLGIDYAWNVERSSDEAASQVEFMIGHAF